MSAFASSCTQTVFVPRATRRICDSGLRPRAYAPPARTVCATISEQPRAEPSQVKDEKVEPFNWVDNWYPIIPEEDAPVDEPYPFSLFSKSYVLFRISPGRWAVLDDRCSHRLAPLSEGRIVCPNDGGAEIECAYHGWGFGGCGRCTRIPQLAEGATIPKRSSVPSYRTVVDVGLIWMFLGDESKAPPKPPLPEAASIDSDRTTQLYSFMRLVPYGYEALVENLLDPEHIHSAHPGADPVASRLKRGKEVLTFEGFSGNQWQLGRNMAGISIPGGFVPPCLVFLAPEFVDLKNIAMLLAMPAKRDESRIFIVIAFRAQKPLMRWLFALMPRWRRHLRSMNVLDGDNILLRGMQHDLGEPAQWERKFLPLETTCDVYVVRFRRWMDKYRDAMPWHTEERPMEMLTRDAMLDRYNSHVVHCKSCMGAYVNFGRAAVAADVIAKICAVTLLCIMVFTFTMDPELIRRGAASMKSLVPLSLLAAVSFFARKFFLEMRAEFVLTDTSRRIFLKP